MSSIGKPPIPPFALISSTAISMDTLAASPHSAPLPVSEAWQPILTLRPARLAASALFTPPTANIVAIAASDIIKWLERLMLLPSHWLLSLRYSASLSCRVLSEIGASDLWHVQKRFAGPAQHDPTALHDVGVVRDLERLAGILLDQQDGLAFGFELARRVPESARKPPQYPPRSSRRCACRRPCEDCRSRSCA